MIFYLHKVYKNDIAFLSRRGSGFTWGGAVTALHNLFLLLRLYLPNLTPLFGNDGQLIWIRHKLFKATIICVIMDIYFRRVGYLDEP